MAPQTAPIAPPASSLRRIRLAYATAFCAALPLALLDGSMAALLGNLPLAQPFDLVRFALFTLGCYAGIALLLATLEIPFVMLLHAGGRGDARVDRAAKGYAATLAIAAALAPLQPLATLLQDRFARSTYAGLALALAGVGLALGAFLIFAVLERAMSALLRRATGRATRWIASPTFALLLPVAAIAAFVSVVAGRALSPGAREAVHLAATAVGLLAVQGALALLILPRTRGERFAWAGVGATIISLLALGSLADAALRAPDGDPAVDAVSHQTLLGAYLVPPLRLAVRGPERGPAILPVTSIHRRKISVAPHPRTQDSVKQPIDVFPPSPAIAPIPANTVPSVSSPKPSIPPPAALDVKTSQPVTAALAPIPKPAPAANDAAEGSPKNLLLVTFDAFDPRVMTESDASTLQEIAARSGQVRVQLAHPAGRALAELWRAGEGGLLRHFEARGYAVHAFEAWNAKGRGGRYGALAPRVVSGSGRRNAADEAISYARRILQSATQKPWAVWLHLPGPTGASASTRKAAAKRAAVRLGWLLKDLERDKLDEKTVLALVGLSPRAGVPAACFIAEPGGSGSRGASLAPDGFVARLRTALGAR